MFYFSQGYPHEISSFKKKPSMLQAMFNLIKSDKTCILMLMLTFHTGFLHSTFVGDFTKSWVSCVKGSFINMYEKVIF